MKRYIGRNSVLNACEITLTARTTSINDMRDDVLFIYVFTL